MNLPKLYEPKEYESTIYGLWETSKAFDPKGTGDPFSIILPPPNANGDLHIGHALTVALQDIVVRYHRMQGRDTVYIPGADHAGFETWVVYERKLQSEGKSRFDFSREEIYTQVWDFVESQRGKMEIQLRELGASLSWDNMVFTLDKKVIDTAYATFKKMWDDGFIYRGEKIVNYCTYHQTSFSDIEVVHRIEKTKLWQVTYPLMDKIGEITVATTRPETMLGDTAIAVHPNDKRYKDMIGMRVQIPLLQREIPIIGDDAVDPEFGTGAVKVTPAHDPMDFEIGQRHDLPLIKVIGTDGKMTDEAQSGIAGREALDARQKILLLLKSEGALKSETEYEHSVGHCYKCDTVIQPLVLDQWFVKVEPLAKRAIEAVRNKQVTFTPASKGKELITYLEQLRDWNISRQPAWGIPIPAFQNVKDPEDWIYDTRVDQQFIEVDGKKYRREEDTFDTWFSSGQWPFIVTDYLSDGDLAKFYPNSVMETGHDILRPWVSRMLMLGLYRTDQVPFKHVYMHGMVLDEKGQKMSKSKGNVVNPIEIVEKYGSDALRMGIIASRSAGLSQAFDVTKVIAGRNFANKLWNMARYIEGKIGDDYQVREPSGEAIADQWVIRQLDDATKQISTLLSKYRFSEAYEVLYHTVWDDVADWYIEASKLQLNKPLLAWVLETCLQLAHPFAPFVTEAIWETLKWEKGMLINSNWPKAEEFVFNEISAAEFERLQAIVSEARFVASELAPAKPRLVYEKDALVEDNQALVSHLARLPEVVQIDQPKGLRLAIPNHELWLELDTDALYQHQSKLELRLVDVRASIGRLQTRLQTESYVKNAPQALVDETRQQLEEQLELEKRLIRELQVVK
jgi:valyl-tRNA synthetase